MAIQKKKLPKKLKANKLEDRIAPGMVGGGIIDPGMVDTVDESLDHQADTQSGEVQGTQIDSSSGSESYQPADAPSYQGTNGESWSSSTSLDSDSSELKSQESAGLDDQYLDDEFAGEINEPTDQSPSYTHNDDIPSPWAETEGVNMNADGSYHVVLPEGANLEGGVINFPVEVANEALPLPEGVAIQTDGSVNVALPEGGQYHEASHNLVLPSGSYELQQIPSGLTAYELPDGAINVNLPPDGFSYQPETHSLNVNNYWANELTPENMEIHENGSVSVTLPEEDLQVQADGSLDLGPVAAHHMDYPVPDYVTEMDSVSVNADGSLEFTPPEGVNAENGIVTFSYEAASAHLPFPEEFHLSADGTSEYHLPEGTQFNEELKMLTLPEGGMNLDQVPEGINAHVNPDGSMSVELPYGINYDADLNSVQLNNYWTNEVTPDHMHVSGDGSVAILLPDEAEMTEEGTLHLPAEYTDYLHHEAPDYLHDLSFSECHPDGSYTCTPPADFHVNGDEGLVQIPYASLHHIPLDPDIMFHQDGTMDLKLPEGSYYNSEAHTLVLPMNTVPFHEIPPQVNPSFDEAGNIIVSLQDGMEFNPQMNSVHLDNYWTNEITPAPLEVGANGEFTVHLPPNVEFHQDGSFTIPEYQADFLETPVPGYVMDGPDWIHSNPDGSFMVQPTGPMEIYPDLGEVKMPVDYMQGQFASYIPEGVSFHSDGTMAVTLPAPADYNPSLNSLTFAPGDYHLNEIPQEVQPILNSDGSISVTLQPGMSYDPSLNSVHLDNYWTNELTPTPVEFDHQGYCHVSLPHDVNYNSDGSFHIPVNAADFMETPYPSYVDYGPSWVHDNPDGSVNVQYQPGMEVNPTTHSMSMPYTMAYESFDQLHTPDFHLNADGTADITVPAGTQYNPSLGTLSFPQGLVNVNEIPEGIPTQVHPDGTLEVTLPEGIQYHPETGSVHLSNQWVNHMTPEPVYVGMDGQLTVNLPPQTQYFGDGSFVIPSDATNFLDAAENAPAEGSQLGLADDIEGGSNQSGTGFGQAA